MADTMERARPMMNIMDDLDRAIRDARIEEWNKVPGPRVGDFLLREDGTLARFTYDHGKKIQTTARHFGLGSFYLGEGRCDYSGALDPAIRKDQLIDTGELEDGVCWFFHHNECKAHNGVACVVKCRVYKLIEKDEEKLAA